jgi:hypothetical protein
VQLGEDGEVTANHLLLGIWSDKESAGHKILASLGFDDEKARLLTQMVLLCPLCKDRYFTTNRFGVSQIIYLPFAGR